MKVVSLGADAARQVALALVSDAVLGEVSAEAVAVGEGVEGRCCGGGIALGIAELEGREIEVVERPSAREVELEGIGSGAAEHKAATLRGGKANTAAIARKPTAEDLVGNGAPGKGRCCEKEGKERDPFQ